MVTIILVLAKQIPFMKTVSVKFVAIMNAFGTILAKEVSKNNLSDRAFGRCFPVLRGSSVWHLVQKKRDWR